MPEVEGSGRTAGVVPPPALFMVALCAGIGAQLSRPLPIFADRVTGWLAGAVLIVPGVAISAWVTLVFLRSGTPVSPLSPSRRLVLDGPYRFSRNPDYIGQMLAYAGVALGLDSWWILLGLGPVMLLIRYAVVAREERYLRGLFGDAYAGYVRRVRRWL